MLSLSLVVIAKNEADNIGRCLDSVPFANDKLVLDSGSTDRTVPIAEAHGARIAIEEWRGFALQKKRATELALHDWVLTLDADEALSPELAKEIESLLAGASLLPDAFAVPRLSFHMGRWIRHGGWYPDWQVKLFNRKTAHWREGEVHEKVVAPKVVRLKSPVLHWVFTDLSDQVDTNNRYSTLGAKQLQKNGKKFSLVRLLVKAKFKFLETYIWKRGFLDGLPGFVIAVGAAYSMFLKHAKLWELQKLSQKAAAKNPTSP